MVQAVELLHSGALCSNVVALSVSGDIISAVEAAQACSAQASLGTTVDKGGPEAGLLRPAFAESNSPRQQ